MTKTMKRRPAGDGSTDDTVAIQEALDAGKGDTMIDAEQTAKDEILKRCRAEFSGQWIGWVMRNFKGRCRVIDMARREPVPGGHSWERRDKVVAEGLNWRQVLDLLDQSG